MAYNDYLSGIVFNSNGSICNPSLRVNVLIVAVFQL